MNHHYQVVIRPGCHGSVDAPVVSRHRSLAAAVAKARRSDRWEVQRSDAYHRLWAPPCRGDRVLGRGLYGAGPQRGEPPLSVSVSEAEAEERRIFA